MWGVLFKPLGASATMASASTSSASLEQILLASEPASSGSVRGLFAALLSEAAATSSDCSECSAEAASPFPFSTGV